MILGWLRACVHEEKGEVPVPHTLELSCQNRRNASSYRITIIETTIGSPDFVEVPNFSFGKVAREPLALPLIS
jgi:hypothetical protein